MKAPRAAAALLVVTLGSRLARGESPAADVAPPPPAAATALVVVIADEPDDAVSTRLARDLRSLGFALMVLKATPENSSDAAALERSGRGLGGVAAIRVWAGARGSELWVLEPSTGQTLTRSLSRAPGGRPDANEVALGTLELLRASLLELHLTRRSGAESAAVAARPAHPAAAESPAPAPLDAGRPRFGLSSALAAELGLRSVGPSASVIVAGFAGLGGCFGARAFAAIPLLAERKHVTEGEVEVEPLVVAMGPSCTLGIGAGLRARANAGIAFTHVTTRGLAIDPARSSDGAAWLGGGFGMLGLGFDVTPNIRLNLDVTGILLPTPASIFVAERRVATWGAPAGLASLGVEVVAGS